jgi:hypothetical protein
MTEHWNIQVNIQKVVEPEPLLDKGGYPVKAGIGGAVQMTERRVVKVLDLELTEDTRAEAFASTHNMLTAAAPEVFSALALKQDDLSRYPISEQAGIWRALLALLERVTEVGEANHEALGHPPHRAGDECWDRFSPAEIEGMIDDAARRFGLPEGWAAR